MSWQAYVDNLVSTGAIDKAAIFSKAGDSVWAATSGFDITPAEIQEVTKGFADPNGILEKGMHIQGAKYFCIRADERSIYGKLEQTGIIAVKTNQAVIVAHYNENTQPGEAVKTVEKLGDYLISVSY